MSFISVFDVMGPNMIGPSSSHTAGAARIAFLAQKMDHLQKLIKDMVQIVHFSEGLWDFLQMICVSAIRLK